jgi:hypothetical protein
MIIPYHSFIAKTLTVIDIHAWIELNKLAFQLNVINFETLMLFLSWWFPTIALLQKYELWLLYMNWYQTQIELNKLACLTLPNILTYI